MGISNKIAVVFIIYMSAGIGLANYNDVKDVSLFSYEKLVALIEKNDLKSVEKTLEVTKNYYPEFFDNYILMYHSRSLQGSSFDAPRAILFDRSTHFVFSFNGKEGQRGNERLEIMQYRAEVQKFEFREIIFSDLNPPQFSEANPPKCMVCHQNTNRVGIDPRPNWEPYNTWPGAFGSISGRMGLTNYDRTSEQLKNADPLVFANAEQESEKLNEFMTQVQPTHPRYKLLNKEKFDPHQVVDLSQLLTKISMERVIRLITKDNSDLYEKIDNTVMGLFKCGQLMVSEKAYIWLKNNWGEEEYKAPKSPVGSSYSRNDFRREFSSTEEYEKYLAYIKKLDEEKKLNENKWKYPEVNTSEGFHHLFEPLGVSTKDWSLDFKTGGGLAFRERFGTPSNTNALVREAFRKIVEKQFVQMSCKELGEKSEKQFDDFMKSEQFLKIKEVKREQEKVEPFILSRCVKCHESGDYSIPQISFSSPERLREELNLKSQLSTRKLIDEIKYRLGDYAKEDERMPLGPMITNKQRRLFINYINQLAENPTGR